MTQGEALSILTTGANVFLTGSPGSGKTHTVNAYVAWLRSHGIEPAITASTGIAATHIHGMTIHSWAGIGIKDHLSPADVDAIASKEHLARRIMKTRVLIIDEVSMLSAGVLSMVEAVTREVRQNELPFGGMQVVLVGDFFQLPPVSRAGSEAEFAFESPSWRTLNPIVCYLTEQHRQEDASLLSILDAIRTSSWDHTDVSRILTRETDSEGVDEDVPRLFTHNADVDRINDEKLSKLPGAAKTYRMESSGAPTVIEGLKRGCLSPELLVLKEGAVVMSTKNNPAAGLVNGTLGTIVRFESGTQYPIVRTRDGHELTIVPAEWAVEEQGKVRAKIIQIPLRLAWAITVHKSQGQSLDAAAMDLSRSFEYGQGYVALSRVRRLDGIHLLGWSEQALRVHPRVAAKDAAFRAASADAAAAFALLSETGERETMERNFIRACGGSFEAKEAGSAAPQAPRASTYDQTLELIKEGKSLSDITALRSLTFGTIVDHIEKLSMGGRLAENEVRRLVPEELLAALPAIHDAFEKKGAERLAPVFMRFKKLYSYEELRLARVLFTTGK